MRMRERDEGMKGKREKNNLRGILKSRKRGKKVYAEGEQGD